MPMFDVSCPKCGWERWDTYVSGQAMPSCPTCGAETNKLWRAGGFPNVIDDTIIGGLTVENLGPTPITFQSKSEHRAYLKAHGITQKVRHLGTPGEGSDKSTHTSRWY